MAKNTLKTILMLMVVWTILPTGPADLFIIPYIIDRIGLQGYVILCILLVIWLYNSVDGNGIGDKINAVQKEIKKFLG
jgi:hypothetical protein